MCYRGKAEFSGNLLTQCSNFGVGKWDDHFGFFIYKVVMFSTTANVIIITLFPRIEKNLIYQVTGRKMFECPIDCRFAYMMFG